MSIGGDGYLLVAWGEHALEEGSFSVGIGKGGWVGEWVKDEMSMYR